MSAYGFAYGGLIAISIVLFIAVIILVTMGMKELWKDSRKYFWSCASVLAFIVLSCVVGGLFVRVN